MPRSTPAPGWSTSPPTGATWAAAGTSACWPMPAVGDPSQRRRCSSRRPTVGRALREEGLDVLDAEEVAARQRDRAAGVAPGGPPWVLDDHDTPTLRPPTPDEHRSVRLLLGRALGPDPARVARRAFAAWPLPLMEARLVRDGGRWRIYDLAPILLGALTPEERPRGLWASRPHTRPPPRPCRAWQCSGIQRIHRARRAARPSIGWAGWAPAWACGWSGFASETSTGSPTTTRSSSAP